MTKFYEELAEWWLLMSPPEEYEEEAGFYADVLAAACAAPPISVLELGSGGGHNASHMKARFAMTLVELSAGLIAVSRALNPDCAHVQGDMRSVRVGREFDAAFVHDAIGYMASEADLRAAIATAFVHCRGGGAALFAPDFVTENFRAGTDHGGSDGGDGRALRFLEWVWDTDPADETYVADYIFAMRGTDGMVRVEHDRHVEGLFPRANWLRFLSEAGFEPRIVPFDHSELPPGSHEIFVARKP
jgi:SAM-dependent methyltransferase